MYKPPAYKSPYGTDIKFTVKQELTPHEKALQRAHDKKHQKPKVKFDKAKFMREMSDGDSFHAPKPKFK